VIDAPGPWGTGPFTLVEGASSLKNEIAVMRSEPFACAWLPAAELRSDRVVLEANRDHWNVERGPRLERVVFRNDLSPAEALELCLSGEGEVDVVTELTPDVAARVEGSRYAELLTKDANRVLVGIFNQFARDVPLADQRAREALNLAVDVDRLVEVGFAGHATPLVGLTPPWAAGYPGAVRDTSHDPARARELMAEAGWPAGRPLRLAAPEPLEPVARFLAGEIVAALGTIGVEVTVVPEAALLAGSRQLVEKKVTPPWDVLLHAWFDLSSDAPPATVHREFFGADGAFRAGPEVPEFDRLFAEFKAISDPERQGEAAAEIDRLVQREALALFLVSPQALYAVNRHVRFSAYRSTLELAETEVDEGHWSLRATREPAVAR
jgi:ABC-type transport system substrate-binding protein